MLVVASPPSPEKETPERKIIRRMRLAELTGAVEVIQVDLRRQETELDRKLPIMK